MVSIAAGTCQFPSKETENHIMCVLVVVVDAVVLVVDAVVLTVVRIDRGFCLLENQSQ